MNRIVLLKWAWFLFGFCLMAAAAGAQTAARTETVVSQPSWVMENGTVRIAVTKLGAQMAPVTFYLGSDRTIEPYYISPWQGEGLKLDPPVLVPLRGDFFCMPFGSNPAPYKGMTFVPHGEPAGSPWSLIGSGKSGAVTTLSLELRTKVPNGKVTKTIHLVEGQNVVYSQERLEGYSTKISLGHHAVMAVPEKEGSLRIATSKYRFGMTSPTLFSNPVNKEYQSFEIDKRFDSLTKVPLWFKGSEPADCTSFPARTGFADLLAVFSEPAEKLPGQVAWTTATNQDGGYLWFSFRDPRVLPMTVFWIENHGRHSVPWNGRNRCLGLEDICGYLNEGMPLSAEPNQVNAQGIPTAVDLSPDRPTSVNYVQGVAKIPAGFRMVKDVEFGDGEVTFVSVTGKRVTVPVNLDFLRTGNVAPTQQNVSREIVLEKPYLDLPVKNGAPKRRMTFHAAGETPRTFEIELADAAPDWWAFMDIAPFEGKTATLTVDKLPEGSTGLSAIDQSDMIKNADTLYREKYRPQFHFSPRRGWNNDPNGLVFYQGEYHMFFQHNPYGRSWGNMHWGHAVSPDLVHWKELPIALYPDEHGTMFSGSAVVDWSNTAGFQTGAEKPLVCIFTAAGEPFTQGIAFSNDRGRTWTKYAGNPVLPHIIGGNRDPKVIWYAPEKKWVMALYLDGSDYALFSSKDLKTWEKMSGVTIPDTSECPEFFEIALDGNPKNTRWVFYGGNGRYLVGRFDGKTFTPESGPHTLQYGNAWYASQTFNDIPAKDGRRILIPWGRDDGPLHLKEAISQMMGIPVELTLRTGEEGPRLSAYPVMELDSLRAMSHWIRPQPLDPGRNPLSELIGELLDVTVELDPGLAAEIGLNLRGVVVSYDAKKQELSCLGNTAPLKPVDRKVRLRVLVDRTSVEIFGNDGLVYMATGCVLAADNTSLEIYARGGRAKIVSLEVHKLKSAWQ